MSKVVGFSIAILLLFGSMGASSANDREEKRLEILKELEGEVPVWAGRYVHTSIDAGLEYCIAPIAGIALVLKYGDQFETRFTGKVVAYKEGRLTLQWDQPCDEPTDMCIVSRGRKLALIRTGDIHRFFIDTADQPKEMDRFFHRQVDVPESRQLPELPANLRVFETSRALYAKVLDVELLSLKKIKAAGGSSTSRDRRSRNGVHLSQRLAIDFGSEAGIFEGLILMPARVGASLEIRIVEVTKDRCIGEIDADVKDATVAIREGELVTTGRVKY